MSKAIHMHQASHAAPPSGLSLLTQVAEDLAVAMDPAASQPDMLEQSEQAHTLLSAEFDSVSQA